MFDPYRKWLQIPEGQRPPTHYQLLGISRDENDPQVIEEAGLMRTGHIRNFQNSKYSADCLRILNEIAEAQAVLLDPARRKAYDARLPATSTIPLAPVIPPKPEPEHFGFINKTAKTTPAPGAPTVKTNSHALPLLLVGGVIGTVVLFALVLPAVSPKKPQRETSKKSQADSSLQEILGDNTLDRDMAKWKTLADRAKPVVRNTRLSERKYNSAQDLQSQWDNDCDHARSVYRQEVDGLRRMYDALSQKHGDRCAKVEELAKKVGAAAPGTYASTLPELLNKERLILGSQDKELASIQSQLFKMEGDAGNFRLEDPTITREISLLREVESAATSRRRLSNDGAQRALQLVNGQGALAWLALNALARSGSEEGIQAAVDKLRHSDLSDDKVGVLCQSLLVSTNDQTKLAVAVGLRAHPRALSSMDSEQVTGLLQSLLERDDVEFAQAAEWLMSQPVRFDLSQITIANVSASAMARPGIKTQLLELSWQGGRDQKRWVIDQFLGTGTVEKLENMERDARQQIAAIRDINIKLADARDVPASTNYAVTVSASDVPDLPVYEPTKWSKHASAIGAILSRVEKAKTTGAPPSVTETIVKRLNQMGDLNKQYEIVAKCYSAAFTDKQRRVALRDIPRGRLSSWGFAMPPQQKHEHDRAKEVCVRAIADFYQQSPPYLSSASVENEEDNTPKMTKTQKKSGGNNPLFPPNQGLPPFGVMPQPGLDNELAELGGSIQRDFNGLATSIQFNQNLVDDDGIAVLVNYPTVKTITIQSNQLTNAGLAHVARCSQLQTLQLIDVPITDLGLEELAKLRQLRLLSILRGSVTPGGVNRFRRLLPGCTVIAR